MGGSDTIITAELLLLAGGAIVAFVALFAVVVRMRRAREDREIKLLRTKLAAPAPLDASAELRALSDGRPPATVSFDGDLRVAAEATFPTPMLVRGSLTVEDGGRFDGSAEIHGDVTLGARAEAMRPLVIHGNLELGPDARVPTCHVHGDVIMAAGAMCTGALRCRELRLVDRRTARTAAPSAEAPSLVKLEGP